MNWFKNLFARESRESNSAQLAKQRLQVVLVQDHLALPPGTMEAIKAEIMDVISRHLEIEPSGVEVAVERRGHGDELVANIPVRRNPGRARGGESTTITRHLAVPQLPVAVGRVGRPGGGRRRRQHGVGQ